jgi:hypothetical protein
MGEVGMIGGRGWLAIGGLILAACMQLEYIEISLQDDYSSSSEISSSSEVSILQIGRYELSYTGISYYEAILLCNRLSLEEGLDTLYQYDKHIFTDDSLFWLPNIKILENRFGYRLPTKEEWLQAKENGEIEKLDENIGEWLYSESNSQYAVFELAPSFTKAVGLYREKEGSIIYGMRVVQNF